MENKLKIYVYEDDVIAVIERYRNLVGSHDVKVMYALRDAHKPENDQLTEIEYEFKASAFPTDIVEFFDEKFFRDFSVACEANPDDSIEQKFAIARQKNPELPNDYQIPFPQDGDIYFVDGLNGMWHGAARNLPKGKTHVISSAYGIYKSYAKKEDIERGITFDGHDGIYEIVNDVLRKRP